MNRYLLDTNILVFIVCSEVDELSPDVKMILEEYGNHLFVSSISFVEFIQLNRIGKIAQKGWRDVNDLLEDFTEKFNISIIPYNQTHIETLANLETIDGHNDPFDHAIISQAITDKLTLISSDRKFKDYQSQNLKFIFNKR